MGTIYFPESAVISEFQILEDGRTIEVGIIGSEGAVGIPSALNSCTAANCTQICVPGTALAVGRDVFEREVFPTRVCSSFFITTSTRRFKQLSTCGLQHVSFGRAAFLYMAAHASESEPSRKISLDARTCRAGSGCSPTERDVYCSNTSRQETDRLRPCTACDLPERSDSRNSHAVVRLISTRRKWSIKCLDRLVSCRTNLSNRID